MESKERELTENERLTLARENAADRECDYRDNTYRRAFIAGCDAAMEYVNSKLAEGVGHLDKVKVE